MAAARKRAFGQTNDEGKDTEMQRAGCRVPSGDGTPDSVDTRRSGGDRAPNHG